MLPLDAHSEHISQILGQMVKKWIDVLPEGVRALEKFNRENKNVLVLTGEEKQKLLTEIRLKNFKGTASGQRIDLTLYTQIFEPLSVEASAQDALLSAKEASNGSS